MASSQVDIKPPDFDQRTLIETALDTTLLVEAAAGTGKTTSMVRRMVELLAQGRCTVDTLAAVTFTRKATAELRARFGALLESEARSSRGTQRQRLQEALDHLEQCSIGTIHSFCARLLRERPVEAGVDIGFQELDEIADAQLRTAAWEAYAARLHVDGDPILNMLDQLGLELNDLRSAYMDFADYPDVECWPAEAVELDQAELDSAREALRQICDHASSLESELRGSAPRDKLMELYLDLPRLVRHARLDRPPDLLNILEECCRVTSASRHITLKRWPGGQAQGREERERWKDFLDEHARPLVERRRQQRYEPALQVLRGATDTYQRMREERGVLNYQDLLMKAAGLLRDKPNVRRALRRRFTHLLVDEFQDTDPIQAQVMLLLTADDPEEQNWQACRPAPGSLFVVGDPKQSIYRFRRADIVTYNSVRRIIESCGQVVELTANFRSIEPVIAWVNTVSAGLFAQPSDYAPADRPMQAARPDTGAPSTDGVYRLTVPPELTSQAAVVDYEAETIARSIRSALDEQVSVPRTNRDIEAGMPTHVVPGDFLVLTETRRALACFAQRLQAYGIPVEVTGGTAVNEIEEVALLHTALAAAVEDDNPVALVGALRSALFGITDTQLYHYAQAGGRFDLHANDQAARIDGGAPIAEALAKLHCYATWLEQLSPIAAIERIAGDLGLFARAVDQVGGNDRAGGLCKAIELLRNLAADNWNNAAVVDYLRQLVYRDDQGQTERHDGMPVRPYQQTPVRVMNLHKAKGLEAPIVFLAQGRGLKGQSVKLHVDRRHEQVRGFMCLFKDGPYGKGPCYAQPVGWAAHEEEEQRFVDAQRDRLLYVAATRAGTKLIVSSPSSSKRWEQLVEAIPEEQVVPEPPQVSAPVQDEETLPLDAPAVMAASLRERWSALQRPTYHTRSAKEMAISGRLHSADSEHGTELGTVLHILLEVAMSDPSQDLSSLAKKELDANDLDMKLSDDLVQIVEAVTRSDLWGRARTSAACHHEVPYQLLEDDDGGTIVRGVIDLVFREATGWVIVDYKTDDRNTPIDALVEHYSAQVRDYARAWALLTGEPVAEAGLYFVHTNTYRTIQN